MKRKVLTILMIGIFLISVNGCGIKKEEKKETEGQEPKYADQIIDGIKISDINLSADHGVTTITAVVHNTTGKDIDISWIDIIFYDAENHKIAGSFFYIDKTIKADGTEAVRTGISSDITNTNRIEFRVEK